MCLTVKNPPVNRNIIQNKADFFTNKKDKKHSMERPKHPFVKQEYLNPLNANPEKWSNTLKQIVGNLSTICLSVFDHFMYLALKGLKC